VLIAIEGPTPGSTCARRPCALSLRSCLHLIRLCFVQLQRQPLEGATAHSCGNRNVLDDHVSSLAEPRRSVCARRAATASCAPRQGSPGQRCSPKSAESKTRRSSRFAAPVTKVDCSHLITRYASSAGRAAGAVRKVATRRRLRRGCTPSAVLPPSDRLRAPRLRRGCGCCVLCQAYGTSHFALATSARAVSRMLPSSDPRGGEEKSLLLLQGWSMVRLQRQRGAGPVPLSGAPRDRRDRRCCAACRSAEAELLPAPAAKRRGSAPPRPRGVQSAVSSLRMVRKRPGVL